LGPRSGEGVEGQLGWEGSRGGGEGRVVLKLGKVRAGWQLHVRPVSGGANGGGQRWGMPG